MFENAHKGMRTEFVKEAQVSHRRKRNKYLTTNCPKRLKFTDSMLYLFEYMLTLFNLLFHLGALFHQHFHTRNDPIIVKNTSFNGTDLGQHLIFKFSKLYVLLSLQLQQIYPLFLYFRLFRFHDLAHALTLEACWGNGEVNQSNARAKVWSQFCCRVLCRQNDIKLGTVIHVFCSNSHERPTPSALDLFVQNWIEYRIHSFHIFYQKCGTEADSSCKCFHEGLIKERGLLDFRALIFGHGKVSCMA
mmetsp:Transcript_27929/g.50832  ORF Transcript_27929/g.50832 Transcript_27929/m.50832 type:complete len:246 (+) Transcript_27929:1365-2102(+)